MSTHITKGWLTKQGGFVKNWKRRFFVLENNRLSYYDKEDLKKKRGTIDLDAAYSICLAPETKKPNSFKIIIPNQRTFFITSDSKEDMDAWMKTIRSNIQELHNDNDPKAFKISLDDFSLIRVIGKGGFGKVRLVKCNIDGQFYAMKTISKKILQQTNRVQSTIQERDILIKLRHPYLVSAYYSFQTPDKLFLVLDYINGGDMFTRLMEENTFCEDRVRLYAAQIGLALSYLHSYGFIYRDLKPENILFDCEGHTRLTDFGLTKGNMVNSDDTTETFCGSRDYFAPEIILKMPYTKSVDWWSYGIVIYEMLTGYPPFYSDNIGTVYQQIVNNEPRMSANISEVAQSLIQGLLSKDPDSRLGSGPEDFEAIKKHPFFSSIHWDDVYHKKIPMPWKPKVKNELDTSNFDQCFTDDQAGIPISLEVGSVSPSMQQQFQDFSMMKNDDFEIQDY